MEKIFNDHSEKYINSIVFYGDTTALKIYYDKEKQNQVAKADSLYAFNKARVIVNVDDVLYAPVQCTVDGALIILDTTAGVADIQLEAVVPA
ncbi:hypothetical protein [Romboutsia sp.]|uniref:hypothetical protein n=1 Tax=Romboutsia sp. TaxID=1965302 RepID=UPI002C615DDD|nr:hypothetical protein [Romboutsia sp.]HSQ89981.1 hypothetical protein [Romboutsia sp.]